MTGSPHPAVSSKRVLIVTNHFPPASGSAVNRVAGYTRYLPQYGWQPIVLTVRDPIGVTWDPGSVARLPAGTRIVRTPWINPNTVGKRLYFLAKGKRMEGQEQLMFTPLPSTETINSLRRWMNGWVLVPDHAVGWLPFAVAGGLRAIRRYDPQVIYSLCRPPTNHLIALILKRLTGRPWVADFQDLWTGTAYEEVGYVYELRWRRKLERWLERHVLQDADHVVALSEHQLAALAETMEAPDPGRLHVISDGYDPEAVREVDRPPARRFTMCYTGKLYGTELRPVCEALSTLARQGEIHPDNFELQILGVSHREATETVNAYGLNGLVSVLPPVEHDEAIRAQHEASALLLVIGGEEGLLGRYPSKAFEYLAARRPLLAMVPKDSEVAQLLRRCEAGDVVDPTDTAAAASAIARMVEEFRSTGDVAWHGRQEIIDRYARANLTGELAELFDSLIPKLQSAE